MFTSYSTEIKWKELNFHLSKKVFKPTIKGKKKDVYGYLQSINQGVGIHKSKKLKGNHRRDKHKKQLKDYEED